MTNNDTPLLPSELWRYVLRLATEESGYPSLPESSAPFGWPYNLDFDASFFRSLATKRNLVIVSHQFSAIASEFLYETIHFRGPRHAISLAEQCKLGSKLAGYLRSWTKSLYITPVFNFVSTEAEIEEIEKFMRSVITITQMCNGLRIAVIQADNITLFQEPTYQPWVDLLADLRSGLHHLSIENFLLGPVTWNPQLFSSWGMSSALRSLRLEAAHPPFEHHFPFLTHLWLFSWPTASQWDMPALTNLYIDYFPGNESTSTFWEHQEKKRPKLGLLHFGGDTDFGLYFPDLPQRLEARVPSLQTLEYHCAGDLDVTWDPSRLSGSVKRVVIRLDDGNTHSEVDSSHSTTGPGVTQQQDMLLEYSSAGLQVLLEMLTELCPSGAHRWLKIERHLERYSSHCAELFVLLPRRVAVLLENDVATTPPVIRASRVRLTLGGRT